MKAIQALYATAKACGVDDPLQFAANYKWKDKNNLYRYTSRDELPFIIKPAGAYEGNAVVCSFIGNGRAICSVVDKDGNVLNKFNMPAEAI